MTLNWESFLNHETSLFGFEVAFVAVKRLWVDVNSKNRRINFFTLLCFSILLLGVLNQNFPIRFSFQSVHFVTYRMRNTLPKILELKIGTKSSLPSFSRIICDSQIILNKWIWNKIDIILKENPSLLFESPRFRPEKDLF